MRFRAWIIKVSEEKALSTWLALILVNCICSDQSEAKSYVVDSKIEHQSLLFIENVVAVDEAS